MMVLHLTDCPSGLRGDLTKWLLEIAAGVFVGQVSARVRENLWLRVQETCRSGRVVLVYSAKNEQHLDFRVHGDTWEPIDFDGIKLMLRPNNTRLKEKQAAVNPGHGFSSAAKGRTAKRFSAMRSRCPDTYVVVDLETTGLNPDTDEIVELGAIKVISGDKINTFHALISTSMSITSEITALTGITNDEIKTSGQPLHIILPQFISFCGGSPIVAHNLDFDKGFLDRACANANLPLILNRCIDTLALARRLKKNLPSYKLTA
ncbi:MAG: type I-E CRISPR-associated endoribonuclease Cas2e, partial [Clostridiales bacterium]|nr:type I-E CRISPR-associated endoribonuclease Cas2e [Clostridiales bacterium]